MSVMFSYPYSRKNQGFTLIELLVVIAIIGILSAVVLASLNTARSKGTDAARMASIKALKTALEIYYIDNSTYPACGSASVGNPISILGSSAPTCAIPLVPKYISAISPLLTSDGDVYFYTAGNNYALRVKMSTLTNSSSGYCKTGVNVGSNWWGDAATTPVCDF